MTGGNAEQAVALGRASMLRMATTWQSHGQINQASDAYFRLLKEYPQTDEAEESREKLLELAACYERSGQFHLAMGLYDKIERACR